MLQNLHTHLRTGSAEQLIKMLAILTTSLALCTVLTAHPFKGINATQNSERSDNPVIGCGILVDNSGMGQATLSDKQCRSLGRSAV